MKSSRLTIQVIKPVKEVFDFTINPKNTPKWIDSIVAEQTNEWPPKVGSVYSNQNKAGEWKEYIVTAIEQNKLFELTSKDGIYHVRYTYRPIASYKCEMEYFEWVDDGELEEPFEQDTLVKLKKLVEGV